MAELKWPLHKYAVIFYFIFQLLFWEHVEEHFGNFGIPLGS